MAVAKPNVQVGLAGWRPRRGNAVIPVWRQSAIELEWADNVDEDESCLMENSLLLRRGQYFCSMLFYLVRVFSIHWIRSTHIMKATYFSQNLPNEILISSKTPGIYLT